MLQMLQEKEDKRSNCLRRKQKQKGSEKSKKSKNKSEEAKRKGRKGKVKILKGSRVKLLNSCEKSVLCLLTHQCHICGHQYHNGFLSFSCYKKTDKGLALLNFLLI